jgi:hypothetical protein
MNYDAGAVLQSRYEAVTRGWMLTKDIQNCVPCGYRKAAQIRKEIEKEIETSGFENLRGCILTKKFLEYMHLSEKKIVQEYEKRRSGLWT